MIKQKRQKIIKNEGYTLIEIVIVLMITAVVFVSTYALFAKSMKYDTEGRYEIIASELAQEGVEIIKNKKEKNEMDWAIWNGHDNLANLKTFKDIDSLSDCNPSLTWGSSGINYTFSCDVNNTKIQYDKGLGVYQTVNTCSNGQPCFDRVCNSSKVDTGNALRVTCQVEWSSLLLNGAIRSVKTTLILTDWER
jgi:prepilin-type N-terminal cleavage/methylation domain-containing protein